LSMMSKRLCEITGMDGWRLVRHLPPSDNWHPTQDRLLGEISYGDSSNDDEPWSVPFGKYDEFLFASGDCEKWLVASKSSVIGETYANNERHVVKSSICSTPYKARWYNRNGFPEDPWISITDHHDAITNDDLLYGCNSFDWASHVKTVRRHGGMNVFVRTIPSIKVVSVLCR
jgi:hypothetical protein